MEIDSLGLIYLLTVIMKKLKSEIKYLLNKLWQHDTTLLVFLDKLELKASSKM